MNCYQPRGTWAVQVKSRRKKNEKKMILLFLSAFIVTGCSEISLSEEHITTSELREGNLDNENSGVSKFNGNNFSVLPKNEKIKVTFSKKVDGDTARFSLNGHEFKTRFLLIDKPETVKPGMEPQPFGKEASDRTNELLSTAETIEIEFDKGDKTDHYKRALCYVYVDGSLIQNILVIEGLAKMAYVSSPNDSLLPEIEKNEHVAKENRVGIWSLSK